jgi:hypothetical protein
VKTRLPGAVLVLVAVLGMSRAAARIHCDAESRSGDFGRSPEAQNENGRPPRALCQTCFFLAVDFDKEGWRDSAVGAASPA